jgi:hypothetical protein
VDEKFLKEHTARCRSLADVSNDPFIKRRLLDLGAKYEDRLQGRPTRTPRLANLPVNAPDTTSGWLFARYPLRTGQKQTLIQRTCDGYVTPEKRTFHNRPLCEIGKTILGARPRSVQMRRITNL